jgi:Alpha amylase, catalytic domain
MDASGDGVGDFRGLLRRLDYLHGLGITTIWLMPFQPSPGKDDGYDISDYYGVDPRYGTLGDFVEFAHGCRQRGIRIIMDLVVNHTSDQHHWFREARSSKDSPYRDWYVWADKRPANAGKGMVFPGVQIRRSRFISRAWPGRSRLPCLVPAAPVSRRCASISHCSFASASRATRPCCSSAAVYCLPGIANGGPGAVAAVVAGELDRRRRCPLLRPSCRHEPESKMEGHAMAAHDRLRASVDRETFYCPPI